MAAIALALAVGRLVPALLDVDPLPFASLGAAFGALALTIFAVGGWRDRTVRRALAQGRFEPIAPALVWAITLAFVALSLASVIVIMTEVS